MKMIIGSLLLLAGLVQAQHHHHGAGSGDRKSVHGMVAFGTTDKVYLSHLPLFGQPHNYQVLLEVSFDSEGQKKYLESVAKLGTDEDKENLNKYHTIEPEAFVLPDMLQDGNSFEARVFRGHFERENSTEVALLQVTINRVLYFQKFDKNAERDEKAHWILFGNKKEQFAAHVISQKPDFDQIFTGSVPGGVAKLLEEKRNIVGVSSFDNVPFVATEALSLTVGDKDVSFSKLTQVYLEEGELK